MSTLHRLTSERVLRAGNFFPLVPATTKFEFTAPFAPKLCRLWRHFGLFASYRLSQMLQEMTASYSLK